MKTRMLSTALFAGGVALFALAQSASAASISVNEPDTIPPALVNAGVAPTSGAAAVQTLTVSGQYRSPYDLNTGLPGPFSGNEYRAIQIGGSATWTIASLTQPGGLLPIGIEFIWGSPDFYNHVAFFNGAVQVGAAIAGAPPSGTDPNLGYAFGNAPLATGGLGQVHVVLLAGGAWTTVVFTDVGQNAFEFAGLQGICTPEGGAGGCTPPPGVPLPAALPLFAGGLGFLGFLARRKKQKAA